MKYGEDLVIEGTDRGMILIFGIGSDRWQCVGIGMALPCAGRVQVAHVAVCG